MTTLPSGREERLARVGLGEREVLLLRAALLDEAAARPALDALRPRLGTLSLKGPDRLDWGLYKMLPLLDANLTRLGIADPWDGRLRGVRNFFWGRTQLRLGAAERAAARLGAIGLPVMLLKGGALVASGRCDPGRRPMDDVDLLVPYGRIDEALGALLPEGWRLQEEGHDPAFGMPGGGDFVGRSATLVTDRPAPGLEIDLHQLVSHFDYRPGADLPLWERSEEAMLGRAPVRVPCVADQIVLVCSHAATSVEATGQSTATLRWVADMAHLLRAAGPADWEAVLAEARRRHLGAMLHDALALLDEVLDRPVPPALLRELWRSRRALEADQARALRVPPERRSRWTSLLIELDLYRRVRRPDLFDAPLPRVVASALRARLRKVAGGVAAPAGMPRGLPARGAGQREMGRREMDQGGMGQRGMGQAAGMGE